MKEEKWGLSWATDLNEARADLSEADGASEAGPHSGKEKVW